MPKDYFYEELNDDFDWSGKVVDYQPKEIKMNKLKSVLSWVLLSSYNSNRISLTIKAGIPFLLLLGISDTATLEELGGSIGSFIASLGEVVFGAITIFGLVRKIWLTMR